MKVQLVPIAEIEIGEREKTLNTAWVEALAENIQEFGLGQPVQLQKLKSGAFQLIDGRHRVEAYQKLSLKKISAVVLEIGNTESKLREIDATLVRTDLTHLDFCFHLAQRKALYVEVHPETKHGSQGGRGGQMNEEGTLPFSKSTAERLGVSSTSIKRAVAVAKAISPELRSKISDHDLARSRSDLEALAKLDPDAQESVIEFIVNGPNVSVKEAQERIAGRVKAKSSGQEEILRKLIDLFGRASAKTRKAFLAHIEDGK